MVVTPKDAIKVSTEREETEIKKLEKMLDQRLRGQYDGTPVKIEIDYGISGKVKQAIIKMYKTAGWKTELIDTTETRNDQREGDYTARVNYLFFKEARK